jgi:hypothetical protein
MAIRIATGGISQETNTFQWEPTTLEDFQKGSSAIHRGQEILDLEGTGTIYGGIIAEAKKHDVEVISTTSRSAWRSSRPAVGGSGGGRSSCSCQPHYAWAGRSFFRLARGPLLWPCRGWR